MSARHGSPFGYAHYTIYRSTRVLTRVLRLRALEWPRDFVLMSIWETLALYCESWLHLFSFSSQAWVAVALRWGAVDQRW